MDLVVNCQIRQKLLFLIKLWINLAILIMKLNFHFQIFQLKQFENLKKILECNCCIIYFFLFQNRKRLEDFIINSDINIHCINKNYTHVTQNHNKKRFTLGIPENRIKRGETLHMHIPFQIFFKSTKPISQCHIEIQGGQIFPLNSRIDTTIMNSSSGFTIPVFGHTTMRIRKNHEIHFYPIINGYIMLDPFVVYIF
jgi:hypothetical protein